MNKGIPDCPDCGGKGMCSKHRLEYLKWVAGTARREYESELKEYKAKLEPERKPSELPSS